MTELCTMCGMEIEDGQGVCSMCYGDPYWGTDGYYMAMLEEAAREEANRQLSQEQQEKENSDD